MTEDEVLNLLQNVGAFRSGHFVYTSGRHGDSYVLKDALYASPKDTLRVCAEMARRFKDAHIDAVIGPAIGAAILAQWTAFHLSDMTKRDIAAVYADKDGEGGFVIKRGYDKLIAGKNVLVVEDLTTTGGSIKRVVDAVRAAGAQVAGAVVLCNRGHVTKEQAGNPSVFEQLVSLDLESWDADMCDLCKKNIPVNTDVGHGRSFVQRAL